MTLYRKCADSLYHFCSKKILEILNLLQGLHLKKKYKIQKTAFVKILQARLRTKVTIFYPFLFPYIVLEIIGIAKNTHSPISGSTCFTGRPNIPVCYMCFLI